MKVIKLNESQYKKLFETSSFVTTAGDEDTAITDIPDEQTQAEVWATSTNSKGEKGIPPGAMGDDPHATQFSPNDWNRRRGHV